MEKFVDKVEPISRKIKTIPDNKSPLLLSLDPLNENYTLTLLPLSVTLILNYDT